MRSADQGTTWKYSAPIARDPKATFNETSMYETPKGDLIAFLRTAGLGDRLCVARSKDRGKTFAPWEAIVGKFAACWAFLALALALTFPVVFTVGFLGAPDFGTILAGYLGSLLLAGAYLAVTVMTSALTRNQVISFILSVVICFFLILCGWEPVTNLLVRWAPDWFVNTVAAFSVMPHFAGFQRGVVDLRDIVFFGSVMVFSLFSTSVILRSLRGA